MQYSDTQWPHEKTDSSETLPQIFTFVDHTYVLLVQGHLFSLKNIYLFSVFFLTSSFIETHLTYITM